VGVQVRPARLALLQSPSVAMNPNVAGVGQSARAAGGGAAVTEGAATAAFADAATPSSPMAETVARADRSSW
jgi:hypothetical protein